MIATRSIQRHAAPAARAAPSHPAPHLTHLASHRFDIQHHLLETPSVAALEPELRHSHAGYVHSIETAATLDGPGIRFVAFLSGCHMRCLYCHNPDTWKLKHGLHVTVDDLMEEIARYADFLIAYGGGVTLSGGEVMVQDRFVTTLARRIKEIGVHLALDTNGYLGHHVGPQLMADVDLWLLDLKAFDATLHQRVTGQGNAPVLDFARRLSGEGRPTWIRFVLVPGLTDDADDIERLADFVAELQSVERVEILPFHQMGAFKWRELGLDYKLTQTQPPDAALIDQVQHQFAARGLRVY
ncbi:MAG: pyruvate formate-lyase-activating protein [Pseudomonadota bacterium]